MHMLYCWKQVFQARISSGTPAPTWIGDARTAGPEPRQRRGTVGVLRVSLQSEGATSLYLGCTGIRLSGW